MKNANAMFRDRNSIFVKDRRTNKWYGMMQMFFLKRQTMQLLEKAISVLHNFLGIITSLEKKETAT